MAQYIEGFTIFDDPSTAAPIISGWSLGLIIVGCVLAVVVLASMGWFLWHQGLLPAWLFRGKRRKNWYQDEAHNGLDRDNGKVVSLNR
jgi:fatty acid desaturase